MSYTKRIIGGNDMKKYLCIAMSVLTLIMTGCSPKERLIDINLQQMQEKMKNKETFVLVFTQPECGYCKAFKKMLDTYLPDHDVTIYDFSIDREILTDKELEKLLADIRVYFPDMTGTPDLYYIKDGKIVDQFDIEKNDLSKEEDFNAWVDKYELNKDVDYSKETK